MSNEKITAIKEKLKKLIAKEESARDLGNQAEAEAFASKIQQLLLEYELDIEEIRSKTNSVTESINRESVDLTDLIGRNEGNWVHLLYDVAAKNNFCMILVGRWGDPRVTLIGEETNREFTHYFVHQLVSKIRELARRSFCTYHGFEKRNTYIRGFLQGAVTGIRTRLAEDRRAAEAATPQVHGLILRKGENLKLWVNENLGRLKTKGSRGSSSNDGYGSGVQAGRGLSVNKGVSGTRGIGGTKLLN